MAQARTGFLVQKNGFMFPNRFTLPFPTTIKLPLVGEINLSSVVYGLCGGMCFAVLDYFYPGLPVPDYQRVEDLPSSYLLYLWNRQIDSMGLVVIPRVIEWMLHDDKDVALSTARYEIPKMRRQLDQSQPVVLGLVRAKGFNDPTVNHQVLATGYDFDEITRQLIIYLCDPNYPRLESTLSINLASPSQGIQAIQSTGEPLRGLFVIKYNPQQPPVEVHPD
jgi:hypothetical protein